MRKLTYWYCEKCRATLTRQVGRCPACGGPLQKREKRLPPRGRSRQAPRR
jgi:predicted ATP-dependent serine protease